MELNDIITEKNEQNNELLEQIEVLNRRIDTLIERRNALQNRISRNSEAVTVLTSLKAFHETKNQNPGSIT